MGTLRIFFHHPSIGLGCPGIRSRLFLKLTYSVSGTGGQRIVRVAPDDFLITLDRQFDVAVPFCRLGFVEELSRRAADFFLAGRVIFDASPRLENHWGGTSLRKT